MTGAVREFAGLADLAPEAIERAHRVREEGDPRTGWVDARRALEDDDVVSGPAQPNRGGQAADPFANDRSRA